MELIDLAVGIDTPCVQQKLMGHGEFAKGGSCCLATGCFRLETFRCLGTTL
jgi:hypothetical protein